MDKKSKIMDKKSKKTDKTKDRGDLKKSLVDKLLEELEIQDFLPDRGDSERKIIVLKQYNSSLEKKNVEEPKTQSHNTPGKDYTKKETDKNYVLKRTHLDLEARKRLREKYTMKLNSQHIMRSEKKDDSAKECIKTDERESKKQMVDEADKVKSLDLSKSSGQSENKKPVKKLAKETLVQRKPIIKTFRLNDDNRMYKAVTFVDEKQSTPIRIKIPNDLKKEKFKDTTAKIKTRPAVAKVSEQYLHKPIKKKMNEKNKFGRFTSPEIKNQLSPPTEVARWAPSCFNRHTKPYYEAWVDTTLAAITKCSKNDKLYLEKQNILQTFKRALEQRPESPDELMYENFNDERYTGRIKIRQR